jgi:CubicO group peptidase (beta-lactamase class C family)
MASEPSPEDHGIPSAALVALIDTLERSGLDPHALHVSRRGADGQWTTVFERAWQPYSAEHPSLVYSVSKTFTSLAIGLLEAEGALSLDDSVGDLLHLPNPNGLTVRHLLTMNSGHSPEQIDALEFDVRRLLTVPTASVPGTRFAYNSDATFALSCIVTALTGERLTDYLRPRLLDPLGIGRRWMKPARSVEQGFSGFHLTVGDIARVSTLLADDGERGGEQVVPASYVAELSQPWSDTSDTEEARADAAVNDWGLGYGYQVWRSSTGFRLDGAYGQFGIVVPDRGIVIAYQGSTLDTQSTLRAFWALIDAVSDVPLQPDEAAVAALDDRASDLDSWTSRSLFTPAPDGGVDTTGWHLDDADDGWRLTLPVGDTIAVGAGRWAHARVAVLETRDAGDPVVDSPPVEAGTHAIVAARGEEHDDGVLVHLIATSSPHRLLLRRGADGSLRAAWHTVPLQGRTFAELSTPEWVGERAEVGVGA